MTLGDQPAFPSEQSECQDGTWNQTGVGGMSYRMWLVGMIASGVTQEKWNEPYYETAEAIILRANAIIKRLEKPE